jgi:heat shock protein HslJ
MMRQYINLILGFGILSVFACAGTQIDGKMITPQNINDIAGIEWHLKQMTKNNEIITLVKDSQTTFACDENGRVAGQATLNRYSGNLNFQDDGEIIWTKAFIMTRMAGPPQLMQQEADFTQALMQTSRMILDDSKLVLKSTDGSTVLEFHSANK